MHFNGILTGCDLIQQEITGKPESMGCDLLQWEITGKPESMGCDLLQWEIMGKPESTGCDLIQWEIKENRIHRGSPIQLLRSSVPSLNWVPLSKLQIKFSHPEQWESDSAQENHTLPCNITLKMRFRDGTIRPPVRANVPSLNQTPMLGLNIALWQRHGSITSSIR